VNTISCMSANSLAKESGYQLTAGWMQGGRATNTRFEPLENFGLLFAELLGQVRAMGFQALDLWTAHLNPAWATPIPGHGARCTPMCAHRRRRATLAG
jgi:hypothetical protein